MSISYYIDRASDWEVSSVSSAGYFASAGGGVWVFEFRSPSVCPRPVLFVYTGGGAGYGGFGASGADSSLDTNRRDENEEPTGFTKIECDNPFSLSDLDGAGGRLTVGEGYAFGLGGGVVIISGFVLGESYFNSQNIFGMGVGGPGKTSVTFATTVGVWKSQYGNMVPSRGSSSTQSTGADDSCSIYDTKLPPLDVNSMIRDYRPGPTISAP